MRRRCNHRQYMTPLRRAVEETVEETAVAELAVVMVAMETVETVMVETMQSHQSFSVPSW